MNLLALRRELEYFEGNIPKVYLDTMGFKTAGIGHLISGVDIHLPVGTHVSTEQIERWFAADIAEAIARASKFVHTYPDLDDVRQRVIVNLAFNLGDKIGQFKNTIRCINEKDFRTAAHNLHLSKWYTQVGRRGQILTKALETGTMPALI